MLVKIFIIIKKALRRKSQVTIYYNPSFLKKIPIIEIFLVVNGTMVRKFYNDIKIYSSEHRFSNNIRE